MGRESRGGGRGPGGASPAGHSGSRVSREGTGGQPDRMLRLLHTADVHLGARHADLGEQAAAQRERQFAAFRATVDLAIAERVDAELRRLAAAKIRTVIIPGTHDVYDRSSLYRVHDLAALAGSSPDDDLVTVLTPDHPSVHLAACDVDVHGAVFATKRAPTSPFAAIHVDREDPAAATWQVGMIHGALAIPDRTDGDEVVFSREEIAASGLDYLALGHWHSYQQAVSGGTTYAYSGAPEPVAISQDGAGNVVLVELGATAGGRTDRATPRTVGKTRFQKLDLDAAAIADQPALVSQLSALADPDLVLDVRLTGVRPD